MYIYAFDLSLSNSGVCIFTNDGKLVYNTSVDTKCGNNHQEKLKIIGDAFIELRKKYEASKIIVEQGFSRFNQSTQAIFKVNGVCQYLFYDVEQIFYPSSTVKKTVGGRGNITKDELCETIMSKYPGNRFENYDESDAFAVGICYFIKKGIL